VAGRRPVEEAFVARRPAIRLLVVPQRRAALEKLVLHATNLRIPIVEVEGGSLTALAGFDGHQGVALVVEPRQFASLDDVLARAAERGEPPFILVLDSLEDPHNVGTLLRSAEAAGVHGVLFPTHRQAPLSPSAVKASAGAIEHLLLCPVDDLPGALSDLHARGVRVAGAEGDAPMTARQSDLRGPLAIVVGSEGQGLGPAVRRRCDLFMRIPMKGAVGSLNAAVAGSILLFEALAQRDPNATPSLPSVDAARPDGPGADSGDAAAPIAIPGSEPLAAPARKARKGLSTQPPEPDETAADVAFTAAPSTKPTAPRSAPKPRATKGSATEPATASTPKPAAKRAKLTTAKPTTAKPSPAKAAPAKAATAKAAPAKAATAKSAASKAPSGAKPAGTKAASADPELAAAATATPRPRKRTAPTPAEATAPAPDPGTVDDDLLPTDGAKKRTRK
jgi:23S rRNA (guanosine2251-2'-O)-methyltransferase